MRTLVTGGFGFIGGHLLPLLLDRGPVHVVDSLASNPLPVGRLIDELGHPANLTFETVPVAHYMRFPGPFDRVVHLASPVGPAGVLGQAGTMVESVVRDAYTLARYAQKRGARLLYVSTSEVYGGGVGGLCREDAPRVIAAKTTPRLEYAVAKLAAETALLNMKDLDVVVVRPFNVAGPRQSGEGGFVLPRFIAQAMLGLPLTVFGDGSARRAFSHVKDIAEGLIRALERGEPGRVYNLGNPANLVTINQLADVVLDVVPSGTSRRHVDPCTIYGAAYAEAHDKYPAEGSALSWRPQYDVRAVVQDTWEYMTELHWDLFEGLAGRAVLEQVKMVGTRPAGRPGLPTTDRPSLLARAAQQRSSLA